MALGGRGRGVSAVALSLLVAALWLLHPVQLSTVLYVVQRMTLLSAFFTLLGLYLYLRLRRRDLTRWKNLALLAGAVYGCTVLAVLCKENGILLPAYLLCLEFILLQGPDTTGAQRRRILGLAALPLAAAVAYFTWSAGGILGGYAYRPFTLGQRLLTEAGVVLDYLKIIILPRPSDFTLFHDDYPVTTGLLTGSALIGLGGVAVLVVSAWLLRKRARLYSFAVAWFLAGQVLESTFIPLELYFEHRNYLPCFGVLLLLGAVLLKLSAYVSSRVLAVIVLAAYPLATTAVTAVQLRLWSDPYKQAVVWAAEHPRSRRALTNLWNVDLMYGEAAQARRDREALLRLDPADLYPYIKQVTVTYCYENGRYGADRWRQLDARARAAGYVDHAARNELGYILQQIGAGHCHFPDLKQLRGFILAMTANPAFRDELGYLYGDAAVVSVLLHDPESATQDIDKAISHGNSLDDRIFKMRILLALGRRAEAERLFREMERQAVSSPGNYIKLSRARSILMAADGKK